MRADIPDGQRPRHFSMIREFHLADFLTLANAASGVAGIFLAMMFASSQDPRHFFLAAAMAPLALLFDIFDGRVARWRQKHSPLGRELDSLADIISFGMAPAALGFASGLNGGWDWVVLTYFVCCGVSRLARFNVTAETLSAGTGKVSFFEGTPIPTSVAITALLAVFGWADKLGTSLPGGAWELGPWVLHPVVLVYALSGTLMISKTLRIPKP